MIPTRKSISRKQVSLILADFIVLAAVPFISLYVYFFIKFGFGVPVGSLRFDVFPYLINIFIFLTVFYIMDLYNFKKDFAKKREIFNIFLALSIGFICSIFFFYLIGKRPLGRGIYFTYITTLFVLIVGYRCLYSKLAVVGIYDKKALIVGAGKGGQALASLIKSNPRVDIDIICLLDIKQEKEGQRVDDVPIVCQHGSLVESVMQHKPDLLILAMRSSRHEKIMKDLIWCSQQGLEIRDMPSIYEELTGKIPLKYVDEQWLLFSYLNQPKLYFKRIKRIADFVFSSLILITTLPIMPLCAAAIKLESPGSVFYRQPRVGKDGKEFELIKFRSMISDAEKETGAVWAGEKDPRITRVGKILRILRIDELPQLFNVIKGEMSLIGPRPERSEFVSDFMGKSKDKDVMIPFYSERFSVKPGITGWAQVMYPYASSYGQSLEKLEYDLFYIKNMSFFLDIAILLKTIRVVLFGRGAK